MGRLILKPYRQGLRAVRKVVIAFNGHLAAGNSGGRIDSLNLFRLVHRF
jgi:hypothetical protein